MTTAAVFLLLLLFSATTTIAAPILGLDSFLSQQSRLDPQATNDSYLSLSSHLKNSLSSSTLRSPSTSSLLSLQLSIPITVKLIGSFPSSAPSILQSFITAAISADHFHVITPFEQNLHDLSISHSLHLDVSLSSPSLSSQLFQTLKSKLSDTPTSLRSPLVSIPYSVVDQIIKQDFEKEKPLHGVYIYLLNLGSVWTGKDRYLWIDLNAGPVDYKYGF